MSENVAIFLTIYTNYKKRRTGRTQAFSFFMEKPLIYNIKKICYY
ncbi:hypothetical protein HMPREF3033_01647 [Veillonellaceae bacterium DNF00751]|nr:hypothetical protein HMPREF3033_01647 [Veillonellaceae bacterium DNF00751]